MLPRWVRPFLTVCAVYDLALGAIFLVAYRAVLPRFGVTLPEHPAYLQFGAAYVFSMGVGLWLAARAPERNRDLLVVSLLAKIAYVAIVFGYRIAGSMPGLWVPFAWCDTAMAVGIVATLTAIPRPRPAVT
ncbi:MAG: hypothetical protein ACM3JJ_12705 [Hyphomicrobiales bacterium]